MVQIDRLDFENEDKDVRHDWGMQRMEHFNPTHVVLIFHKSENKKFLFKLLQLGGLYN